jgi:hypothetical protein
MEIWLRVTVRQPVPLSCCECNVTALSEDLGHDVAVFIAERARSNVRELEVDYEQTFEALWRQVLAK